MSSETGIEWTDSTWNPIRGCSRVSEGCRNCYAEKVAYRFSAPGQPYEGLMQLDSAISRENAQRIPKWNGQIKFVEDHLLDPLKWKPVFLKCEVCGVTQHQCLCERFNHRPRRIFVNSMSDLFHENVTDEMRDRIFAVMALCPQHIFQVLTKRPKRMLEYFNRVRPRDMSNEACDLTPWYVWRAANLIQVGLRPESTMCPIGWNLEDDKRSFIGWPLPNVWLGVSVENQQTADERIPLLLQAPAVKRFISAEPLLGLVSIAKWTGSDCHHEDSYAEDDTNATMCRECEDQELLDWVIVGGESGPGARPMHPDWARSLRDQCVAAGVPFFFKQWGEWGWEEPIAWTATPEDAGLCYGPFRPTCTDDRRLMCRAYLAIIPGELGKDDRSWVMLQNGYRIGKKAAGRLLDGREWSEVPA